MAYIVKENLIKDIRKYADLKHSNGEQIEYVNGILKSISVINEQLTADVEEVVRCKDCERVNKYKDRYFCRIDNSEMNADDFCSYGERKTDNEL